MPPLIDHYILIAFSLDFEGSLHISTSTNKYGGISFQPVVSIGNTSSLLLRAFQKQVGFGAVTESPTYSSSRAPVHYWLPSADEIRLHLPLIEPHLVLKRQQAQLLIEACSLLRTRHTPGKRERRSEEHTAQLLAIRDELQRLNISPCYRIDLTDQEKFLIELRRRGT